MGWGAHEDEDEDEDEAWDAARSETCRRADSEEEEALKAPKHASEQKGESGIGSCSATQ